MAPIEDNAPMAWQLTVGALRRALAAYSDEAVVGLSLPPGLPGNEDFTTLLNLRPVQSASPAVLLLEPVAPEALNVALFGAVRRGSVADTAAALDSGADVRMRDLAFGCDAELPLHAAAGAGCTPLVELLLERGAPVDARSATGWTALMRAAQAGDLASVRILLKAGAEPNLRNDEGYTALGRTAESKAELMALLTACGAVV